MDGDRLGKGNGLLDKDCTISTVSSGSCITDFLYSCQRFSLGLDNRSHVPHHVEKRLILLKKTGPRLYVISRPYRCNQCTIIILFFSKTHVDTLRNLRICHLMITFYPCSLFAYVKLVSCKYYTSVVTTQNCCL